MFDDYILDKAILAWCWGVDGLLLFPGKGYGDKDINRAMIYIYLWLQIPLHRGWMGRPMDDMTEGELDEL